MARFIQVLLALVVLGCACAILFPIPQGSRQNARRASCQSNLKQMALVVAQYVRDADGHYPPVSSGRSGWATLLQPYAKSWDILQCPSVAAPTTPEATDYWFNVRLAGKSRVAFKDSSLTLLLGEGADNSAPDYALSQIPAAWLTDEKSPSWRHLDGANYAFADGHIKWFKGDKPKEWSSDLFPHF